MRYLKVFERKNGEKSTLEGVRAALVAFTDVIVEDQYFGFPCVEFPESYSETDIRAVKQALIAAGYEPY